MKKVLLISSFFIIASTSFAQPGGGWPIVFNEDYNELDTLSKSFLALFDWTQFDIEKNDRVIIATLRDSVLPVDMISDPYLSDSFYIHHPAFKDHWTTYVIQIRLLTRMTEKERKLVTRYNDSIQRLIKNLPKKLGIEHLLDLKDMYYAKTEKDRKKIEQFEKEKQRLYNQLFPLPQFSTEYLDVYVEDAQVFDGYIQHPEWRGYYLVPDSANALRWKIWDGVKEIEKRFGK